MAPEYLGQRQHYSAKIRRRQRRRRPFWCPTLEMIESSARVSPLAAKETTSGLPAVVGNRRYPLGTLMFT